MLLDISRMLSVEIKIRLSILKRKFDANVFMRFRNTQKIIMQNNWVIILFIIFLYLNLKYTIKSTLFSLNTKKVILI